VHIIHKYVIGKRRREGRFIVYGFFRSHGAEFFLAKASRDGKEALQALSEKKIYGRKVRRNNQVTYFSVFATLEILTTWKTGGSLQEANHQSSIEIPRALIPESRFFT